MCGLQALGDGQIGSKRGGAVSETGHKDRYGSFEEACGTEYPDAYQYGDEQRF
jgi:hypothetical protein